MPERACKRGSKGSLLEMPEMSHPLARAFQKCGYTTVPGYRVYFKRRGRELIILLAGGDKNTQAKDIKTALRLARNLSE